MVIRVCLSCLVAGLVLLGSGPVFAQELMVYPAKGQSQEQQQKDEFECYQWAVKQSGFDPSKPQQASAPPPQGQPQGGAIKGAAGGAALGAIGGAIAGDAGKGAAIGAATGGAFGAMRRAESRRRMEREDQSYEQQQQAAYSQGLQNYNRAKKACLEGRGYTVQ